MFVYFDEQNNPIHIILTAQTHRRLNISNHPLSPLCHLISVIGDDHILSIYRPTNVGSVITRLMWYNPKTLIEKLLDNLHKAADKSRICLLACSNLAVFDNILSLFFSPTSQRACQHPQIQARTHIHLLIIHVAKSLICPYTVGRCWSFYFLLVNIGEGESHQSAIDLPTGLVGSSLAKRANALSGLFFCNHTKTSAIHKEMNPSRENFEKIYIYINKFSTYMNWKNHIVMRILWLWPLHLSIYYMWKSSACVNEVILLTLMPWRKKTNLIRIELGAAHMYVFKQ